MKVLIIKPYRHAPDLPQQSAAGGAWQLCCMGSCMVAKAQGITAVPALSAAN
jgi:hypothetical protein